MINHRVFVELLKVINCMSYAEFKVALCLTNINDESPQGEYWLNKFQAIRKNIVQGLGELDDTNQKRIIEYAQSKMANFMKRLDAIEELARKMENENE